MQKNMKVDGLASKFQVCTNNFLVFWGPVKFGLEKGTGGDPPPLHPDPQSNVNVRLLGTKSL